MNDVQRVFLGWERPVLQVAAARLLQDFGPSMGHVTVAVPGRRASRRLLELLAQAAPPSWVPPHLTTLMLMTREASRGELPHAGPTLQTLAWVRALQKLSEKQLLTLATQMPDSQDLEAWLPMAEMVQSLAQELAAETWTFLAVSEQVAPQDRTRWKVLAQVQQDYVELLREAGATDSDWLQLQGLEIPFQLPQEEVLVVLGVADAHPRQRRFLERTLGQRHIWIAAPEALADAFDAYGFLIPEPWQDRPLHLDEDQVMSCTTSEDQAKRLHLLLQGQRGKFSAEEVTLGLLQSEHRAEITQSLAQEGVNVHDPEGLRGAHTTVARLLVALADWLEDASFAHLAALLRHEEARSWLTGKLERTVDLAAMDAYHQEHLSRRAGPDWRDPVEDRESSVAAHARVRKQAAALWNETADLRGSARPAAAWAPCLTQWLQDVYAAVELDRRRESDRRLALTLERCAEILMVWQGLPQEGSLAPPMRAAEAIRLFLRELKSFRVAPQTLAAAAVETVGWLELSLDDAPLLVLTDFQETLVPAAVEHHALLDVDLCARLQLSDERQRWARDRYWLECLLQTRANTFPLQLFLCRISRDGQPLLPSRFLFLDAKEEVVVHRAVALFAEEPPQPPSQTVALPPRTLLPGPRDGLEYDTDSFSCSRLNRFLDSPYAYYLEYVLKLKETDDQAREMDPLLFGSLLHRILERYGKDSRLRALEKAVEIEAALLQILKEETERQFGQDQLPAVRLQLASAATRLHHFARMQEERMAQGWRIQEVEWAPPGESVPVEFGEVSFRLRGKIDRIDRREVDGHIQWCIYDYKAGDKCKEMSSIYQARKGVWRDVQMALYPRLARDLTGGRGVALKDGPIKTAYWNLGASEGSAGLTELALLEAAEENLEEQVAAAVRAIREGRFFDDDQNTRHRSAFAIRCMGDGFLEELEEDTGGVQ